MLTLASPTPAALPDVPSHGLPNASSLNHVWMMLADDWGSYDASFRMQELGRTPDILTPSIDALAQRGLTFSNYYVQPICSPTRASLLSGRYSIHTGSEHQLFGSFEPSCLPTTLPLMPAAFKALGFQTHMIGKCAPVTPAPWLDAPHHLTCRSCHAAAAMPPPPPPLLRIRACTNAPARCTLLPVRAAQGTSVMSTNRAPRLGGASTRTSATWAAMRATLSTGRAASGTGMHAASTANALPPPPRRRLPRPPRPRLAAAARRWARASTRRICTRRARRV